MANELTLNAILAYADAEGSSESLGIPANVLKNVTTLQFFKHKQNIAITEVAINLGGLPTLGYYLFINRDVTNSIDIKVGTGGALIAHLDANNGFAMGKFGSGITAPYAIANVATCQMEYLLIAI